jgi:ADP-heptose:LPS heptosyltransferase
MRKIIFQNKLSLGDVVVCTAAIRDLHRAYPGEFKTGYTGTAPELFKNNPHIENFNDTGGVETIVLKYPAINTSNQRPLHFIGAYHEFLEEKLYLKIPVTEFKGDIHLSDEEKGWTNQVQNITKYEVPFWIIVSGGKYDFTCKWWDHKKYQQVVDSLKGEILFVQVGSDNHHHPPLKGAIDLRGKTDVRQLVRLVYHSSGVVCPVTGIMHMAAAVPTKQPGSTRPCVVVAGGREPVSWEHYPPHQFLHTQGMLDCCKKGGCWKSRVEPRNDGSKQDSCLCSLPVIPEGGGIAVPKCMDMISSDDVVRSIRKYIEGGASPTVNDIIWSGVKQHLT